MSQTHPQTLSPGRTTMTTLFWETSSNEGVDALSHARLQDEKPEIQDTKVFHHHFVISPDRLQDLSPLLSFSFRRFELFFDTPECLLLENDMWLRFVSTPSESYWTLKVLFHSGPVNLLYCEYTDEAEIRKVLRDKVEKVSKLLNSSASLEKIFPNCFISYVTYRYQVKSRKNVKVWFDIAQFERECHLFMGTFEGDLDSIKEELESNVELRSVVADRVAVHGKAVTYLELYSPEKLNSRFTKQPFPEYALFDEWDWQQHNREDLLEYPQIDDAKSDAVAKHLLEELHLTQEELNRHAKNGKSFAWGRTSYTFLMTEMARQLQLSNAWNEEPSS
jgi:hypothetical protein